MCIASKLTSPLNASCIYIGVIPSSRASVASPRSHQTDAASTSNHQLPIAPQLEGSFMSPFSLRPGSFNWFHLPQVLNKYIVTATQFMCAMADHAWQTLFHCRHPLLLALIVLVPLLQWSPTLENTGDITQLSHFGAKHPTISWSLDIDLSFISVLIVIYWKKELLWWGLADALIYMYKRENSGGCLLPCQFRRMIVLGSPLWLRQSQILAQFTVTSLYFWGIYTMISMWLHQFILLPMVNRYYSFSTFICCCFCFIYSFVYLFF